MSAAVRTDADLLAALSATDGTAREAWQVLVARHSGRMYGIARSFSLDPQAAEDVVQTAWLRLVERPGQIRDGAALGGWLATVVRNEALRILTRRRELPSDDVPDTADPRSGSADRLVRTERDLAIRVAFSRLGAECRQLLLLCLCDPPLSYEEIAAALGRPRGSLGPSRRRCLDRLRALLPAGIDEE